VVVGVIGSGTGEVGDDRRRGGTGSVSESSEQRGSMRVRQISTYASFWTLDTTTGAQALAVEYGLNFAFDVAMKSSAKYCFRRWPIGFQEKLFECRISRVGVALISWRAPLWIHSCR